MIGFYGENTFWTGMLITMFSKNQIVENIDLFSVIKPKNTLLTDLICIAILAGIWQENWWNETNLMKF